MKKACIVVGHTVSAQGASNTDGTTEYVYNSHLAHLISQELHKQGVQPFVVYRGKTIFDTCQSINALDPDVCVELHCNAFNTKATGTETLYWYSSARAKDYATKVQKNMVEVLGLADRGIKPIESGDRGATILQATYCPCVLVESFFIDNTSDLQKGQEKLIPLAHSIANALVDD